nr:uncharacterized protein LOC109189108 isoform X2 [Ipomoea batatas]GMC68446.1 uncharacterized protein LOC109189108 isoform X2 [Ipomoea batatas]
MILFAGESISALSSNDTSKGVEQRHWSYSQESAGSMNHTVPDGAIVAIEDVCQHMFIAVDRAESGYALVGEIHYTLAGERALFRFSFPFSITSLLNCRLAFQLLNEVNLMSTVA